MFIGIALLISVLAIIHFNVSIDNQGLEVDPDEDVDIMIDEQIKEQSREWFALKKPEFEI